MKSSTRAVLGLFTVFAGCGGVVENGGGGVASTLVAYPQIWLFQPFRSAGFGCVAATLSSGGNPVVGRDVDFSVGTLHVCSAITSATGLARCAVPNRILETMIFLGGHYSASFAGDASYLPSSATTPTFRFF